MPLLLFCRLASMLSACVVTGLLEVEEGCVDDMARTLPRSSGWALGRAGMPPPAAQQTMMHLTRQRSDSNGAWKFMPGFCPRSRSQQTQQKYFTAAIPSLKGLLAVPDTGCVQELS